MPIQAQEDSAQVDYYISENILRFADQLFASADYLRAAGEYRRYLFSAPDSFRVIGKIAHCYQLGGQPEKALRILAQLSNTPDVPQTATLQYEIARAFSLMGQYDKSLAYLDTASAQRATPEERWQLNQLVGFNYLQLRRWSEAREVFTSLVRASTDEEMKGEARKVEQYAFKGERLPLKIPLLAGTLSTVIPGAGKVYSARSADGLYSLLTVSFLGWLAFDGFHRDGQHSVKGWIFAPLAGVFHLGNIYGSVIAARIYNRGLEREFLTKISLPLPR